MRIDSTSRLILNTLATYARSLIALIVGVFTSRWVLNALGAADFGLYSLTGSIVLLATFINTALSIAISRFYAFYIGHAAVHGLDLDDHLNQWFNTAFSLHLSVAVLVLLIVTPIGEWAMRYWLNIPAARLNACVWVFRTSLAAGIVSILSVPYISMYVAHQYIAELSIFQMLSSVISFAGAWSLRHIHFDRLLYYAGYMFLANAGVLLIQMFRAHRFFGLRCRIDRSRFFLKSKIRELMPFLGWKLFGTACVAGRNQGLPILVNLHFGPTLNASLSISQTLSNHAQALSTAMVGAMQPALTAIYATDDRERLMRRVMQSCKLATLLLLFFAIPLWLGMPDVVRLWLKIPPPFTSEFCRLAIVTLIVERLTNGHMIAVNATGKIKQYELVQGILLWAVLPLTWIGFKLWRRELAAAESLFLTTALYSLGRLVFAKRLLKIGYMPWIKEVLFPIAACAAAAIAVGFVTLRLDYPNDWLKLLTTSTLSALVLAISSWMLVFSATERLYLAQRLKRLPHSLRTRAWEATKVSS